MVEGFAVRKILRFQPEKAVQGSFDRQLHADLVLFHVLDGLLQPSLQEHDEPEAGVVAVEAAIPMWSVLLGIGVMFWVAGFDLLYSLQDMEFDKKEGLFSIPSQFGAEATLFIAAVFHGVAVLFWIFFAWSAALGFVGWLAVIFSGAMLWYEHQIVRRDFTKIDRAFFTVNGYLGIIFLIIIIIDRSVV